MKTKFTIKIEDDCKERDDSFEARVTIDNFKDIERLGGYSIFTCSSYGFDEQDALKNLKTKISAYIKQLQEIDYKNYYRNI